MYTNNTRAGYNINHLSKNEILDLPPPLSLSSVGINQMVDNFGFDICPPNIHIKLLYFLKKKGGWVSTVLYHRRK